MRYPAMFAALVIVASTFAQDKPNVPGSTSTGFLLPNGWHLTPAGKHLVITDLPLNIVPLKDGKRVLIATSGYNRHELILADISGDEPKAIA